MHILQAKLQHIPDLIPLFDGYRMFYKQPSDYNNAKTFLTDRIKKNAPAAYTHCLITHWNAVYMFREQYHRFL